MEDLVDEDAPTNSLKTYITGSSAVRLSCFGLLSGGWKFPPTHTIKHYLNLFDYCQNECYTTYCWFTTYKQWNYN